MEQLACAVHKVTAEVQVCEGMEVLGGWSIGRKWVGIGVEQLHHI